MTQEEKARAYDEALEKARMYRDNAKAVEEYSAVARYENIFPELRESEDERIRRTLVEYFGPKVQLDFVRGVPIQKIRDWLEKQKENPKNAISIPADCATSAKCEDRWHKTANSLPDDGRDVLAKDALGNYLLASFDGAQWFVSVYDGEDHPVLHTPPILEWCEIPSEKQKEQKPIKVYRVENENKQKGLWRKFDGTWEPLFDMLTDGLCRNLPMQDSDLYRAEGKKWFASSPSRETLQKWFSKRDLEELTAAGFTISEFEVTNYKKVSEFEYIFTRDSIINRTYLTVSDIYPEQKPAWSEDIIRKAVKEIGLTQHQIDWFKTNVFPPKQEWSEEDEKMLTGIIEIGSVQVPPYTTALREEQIEWLMNRLKSLRPQPREEIYQSAKHDLAIKFMNYLDENRPEGKMSLSNGECEDIDKAFKENDWAKIMRYVEKYRPSWKPSEEHLSALLAVFNDPNNIGSQTCQLALTDLYEQLKKL